MDDRDLQASPLARELTPVIRQHLQDVLAQHGIDEHPAPAPVQAAGGPHVVGATPPAVGAVGGLGLSSILTSSVVQYALAIVVGKIQQETMPPLLAALREVKRQHPDFDPALILAPINRLLGYFGLPPVQAAF